MARAARGPSGAVATGASGVGAVSGASGANARASGHGGGAREGGEEPGYRAAGSLPSMSYGLLRATSHRTTFPSRRNALRLPSAHDHSSVPAGRSITFFSG